MEGDKGKHLSNLQRAHWYVEWTLVCAPRLGLFFFGGKQCSSFRQAAQTPPQTGDSAWDCCHYQLTVSPLPPASPRLGIAENGGVLLFARTAQSTSLKVYDCRQNIAGCPTAVTMFVCQKLLRVSAADTLSRSLTV